MPDPQQRLHYVKVTLAYEYISQCRQKLEKILGKDTYLELVRQLNWQSDKEITEMDFYAGGAKLYNNFIGYFMKASDTSVLYETYEKDNPIRERFEKEHPKLYEKISHAHARWWPGGKTLLRDLYRAYCIMRTYDGVSTNADLFR
jgi:hypothetical protein